jgi:nucleoside-diphosphate-sugar epimerase
VQIEIDAARLRPEKSEVQRLLSDNARAKEIMGWEPQVSFEEGLGRTIEWVREHLGLYRSGEYQL